MKTPTHSPPHRLPLVLVGLMLAAPAFGDRRDRDFPMVVDLEDCPEVHVLGSGNIQMLSLSQRGFLGVETSELTPELRRHFGVVDDAGIMISRVVEDSAAAAAGLEVGDIITRVDDEEITSPSRLGSVIRRQEGGAEVEIEYWRAGDRDLTMATLEERKGCAFDVGTYLEDLDLGSLHELGTLGIQIGEGALGISGEALESAMEGVREALESQDWQRHFEGLEEINLDELERNLERVQRRLERLEERLEREYGEDLEDEEDREDRDRSRGQSL